MDYDIGQVVIYQGIIGWIIDKKEMLDFPLTTVSMQYKIEWADDSEIEWYSKETINEFIEELEDMEKKL